MMPPMSGGSSPRLRGTPYRQSIQESEKGIIPALAGNTMSRCPRFAPLGDHPRACGEHIQYRQSPRRMMGSSPRLRGTPHLAAHRRLNHGIIPALAGNTTWSRCRTAPTRDHPRACGEHQFRDAPLVHTLGSSPRLRGTPTISTRLNIGIRIIPALAGNTTTVTASRPIRWDHPRACGEHGFAEFVDGLRGGSSPRLRGTRPGSEHVRAGSGIIPALAGNTLLPRLFSPCPRDHPRACGEHVHTIVVRVAVRGSSPRLRGTRQATHEKTTPWGIIPALAGNTN